MGLSKRLFTVSILAGISLINGSATGKPDEAELAEKFKKKLGVHKLYVSLDHENNILVTGFFSDSLTIGNKKMISKGVLDIFIAKYDTDQNLLWLRHAGGANIDFSKFINNDRHNNIYIQGLYRGKAYFDGYHLDSNGTYDYFTAKYSHNGELLYVKTRKGSSIVKSPEKEKEGWFWSRK